MEKTVTITLSEMETGLVWQALRNISIMGKDAPLLVEVMRKIQETVAKAEGVKTDQAPLEYEKLEEEVAESEG